MTPEEITKLAEELAKDWMDVNNIPDCLGNEVLSGMAKEMERVICFILDTHCIVSKEKVREVYDNANPADAYDRFENGYNLGVIDTLKSLFAPTPLTKLINDRSMKDKPILDACCGGRMFYFDKHNPNVLFQDIREIETTLCDGRKFEVKPDVQADFTNMPYPNDSFRMVIFDPPHLLRNVGKSKMADMYGSLNEKAQPAGYQHIKYGALYSDWRDMLSKGFAECFRVLMPSGFLIFKWNETDIKVSEVLKLTDQKPIFGHISGKRSNTHWICFMKSE